MANNWDQVVKSKLRKAVRLALNEIGRRGVKDIRQSIEVPVQHIGGVTIRSEPGEPPRYDDGNLWKSIKYKVRAGAGGLGDLIIYVANTIAPHAPWVNYGTKDGRIEPRPFWEPAERRIRSGLKSLFIQLVKEKLDGLRGTTNEDFSDEP